MTLRQVHVRIAGLLACQEGALWRELVDGPHIPLQDMLATVADFQAMRLWQAAGDKSARKPRPMPRVGDDRKKAASDEKLTANARRMKKLIAEGRQGN